MEDWITLALIAPFFWGLSNILDKIAIGNLTTSYKSFAFFISVGNLLFFLACILYAGVERFNLSLSILNLASGFFIFAQYYFYSLSLEMTEVDVVIPLHQTEPIFVLAISYIVFKNAPLNFQVMGIFITVLGCLLLTMNWKKGLFSLATPYFPFILLSALLGAVATVTTSYLLSVNNDYIYVAGLNYLGYSLGGFGLLLFKSCRSDIWKDISRFRLSEYAVFGATNLCDALGYFIFTAALGLTHYPSTVSAIVSIHPMYVLVMAYLAYRIFNFNMGSDFNISPRKKTISTLLVVTGVVIITFSERSAGI